MKKTKLLLLFITILLSYSCSKQDTLGGHESSDVFAKSLRVDEYEINQQNGTNDWEKQLRQIIAAPPQILKESGIELVDFRVIDYVQTTEEELLYKGLLESNENMFPLYLDDFKRIKAIKRGDLVKYSLDNQKFTLEKGLIFIKNLNLQGSKIVDLKWNNNGEESHTICVISSKGDITYDNFITNTFLVSQSENTATVSNTDGGKSAKFAPGDEDDDIEGPRTKRFIWTLTHTATWLWGSERGEVEITHSADYNGDTFLLHNFHASHYMSIGNSQAEVSEVATSTIAYGYGLSTPFITITLAFTGSSYNLSFSSSLGSTSGGTGQHSF